MSDASEKIKDWFEAAATAQGKTIVFVCPDDHRTEWVCPGQVPPEVPCTMIVSDLDGIRTADEFVAAPVCGKMAVPE